MGGIEERGEEAIGVVQQETIKVSIPVHIKESSLARVGSCGIKPISSRLFRKLRQTIFVNSFVDKQLLCPVLIRSKAGIANKDIQQAIAINVNHRCTRAPRLFSRNTGMLRDIFKPKISLVNIKHR